MYDCNDMVVHGYVLPQQMQAAREKPVPISNSQLV